MYKQYNTIVSQLNIVPYLIVQADATSRDIAPIKSPFSLTSVIWGLSFFSVLINQCFLLTNINVIKIGKCINENLNNRRDVRASPCCLNSHAEIFKINSVISLALKIII